MRIRLLLVVRTLLSKVAWQTNIISALKSTQNILENKLDKATSKISKICAEKAAHETFAKEIKAKHLKEASEFNAKIKANEKYEKNKEKENNNLKRNLENARETIQNMKSEKSQAPQLSSRSAVAISLSPMPSMTSHLVPYNNPSQNLCSMRSHYVSLHSSFDVGPSGKSQDASDNKYTNIELEKKEDGFIRPRLP